MILFSKVHTPSVILLSTLLCCGCFFPEKHDLTGLEDLKNTVRKLNERGIKVHYNLLDQGGGMVHGNFGGFIDEETAWKQLGEDALATGGFLSCTGLRITNDDVRLLGKLPRLREARFGKCTFALNGSAENFSVREITLFRTSPTEELFQAVNSSRITLEVTELPKEHASILFRKGGFPRIDILTKHLATDALDDFSADITVRNLAIHAPNFSHAHMKQLQSSRFLESLKVDCAVLDDSQLQAAASIDTLQSFECEVTKGLNHTSALLAFSDWQSCRLSGLKFKAQRNPQGKRQGSLFHKKPAAKWFDQRREASFFSGHGAIVIRDGMITFKANPSTPVFDVSDLRFAEFGDAVTGLHFDQGGFDGNVDSMMAEFERLDNITTVTITNRPPREFSRVPALAALANLKTVHIEHATPSQASDLGRLASLRRIEISAGGGNSKRQEVYEGLPHVAEIQAYIANSGELETLLLNPNLRRLEICGTNLSTQDVLNALATENLQHLEVLEHTRPINDSYIRKKKIHEQLLQGVWPHYEVINTHHQWPGDTAAAIGQPTHIFRRVKPNAP